MSEPGITDGMEEVPMEIGIPPIEEVCRAAAINVRKMDTSQGQLTFLQFITPFKMYTFQLDHAGAEALSDAVRPSKIIPATVLPTGFKRVS